MAGFRRTAVCVEEAVYRMREEVTYVECNGTPREMGRQYGEQAREPIHKHFAFLEERFKRSPKSAPGAVAALRRCLPAVLDEFEGIAEGCGLAVDYLVGLSHGEPEPFAGECTSLACELPDVGPAVIKNNDGDQVDRPLVVRKSTPRQGLPMIQVVFAGWLSGLDAMNAAGLAMTHNSVGSKLPRRGERVACRLWAYHILRQATTVREALDLFQQAPLMGKGFNIVLGDAEGSRCVAEAALPLVAPRSMDAPWVYATNHFILPELAEMDRRRPRDKQISAYRYGYLEWVEANRPPQTLEALEDLFRSHEPWAPCRHGGSHVSYTHWSMVALLKERRVRVAPGPPCEIPYQDYTLEA